MAPVPSEIIDNAKRYLDAVSERGFIVLAAYLFGSYARGDWNDASDIDIAIVSAGFDGNRFLDRQKLIGLHRNIDLRISPLPFSPPDFDNSLLHDEIVTNGICLV
jgi:uncharacterized protein